MYQPSLFSNEGLDAPPALQTPAPKPKEADPPGAPKFETKVVSFERCAPHFPKWLARVTKDGALVESKFLHTEREAREWAKNLAKKYQSGKKKVPA